MKSTNFQLIRYDADDGHVFDWAEPHYIEVEKDGKMEKVQEHLYGKTIFIGGTDKIENYIEVAEPIAAVEEA